MDPVTAYKTVRTARAVASHVPWKPLAAVGAVTGLFAAMLVGSAAFMFAAPTQQTTARDRCTVLAAGTVAELDAVQTRNAAVIVATGTELGVPPHGLVVALATALQESRLRNLASRANPGSMSFPHDGVVPGDHDSVGLFQQRDAWGPLAARMDPAQSAGMFYTGGQGGQPGLLDKPGWQDMEVWRAAQAVQVSAFPTAYEKWEATAHAAVTALLPGGHAPLGCTPGGPAAGPLGVCPATGDTAESQLTPDAVAVWRCVKAHYPTEYGMGGYGYRENNPGSDHSTGRAVDVMTGPHGDMPTPEQEAYGWALAEWLLKHHAKFGIKYVIFAGKIRNPSDTEWRHYTHPRRLTDPTHLHYDHVHVSVRGTAGALNAAGA